jgi:hypothetical protein
VVIDDPHRSRSNDSWGKATPSPLVPGIGIYLSLRTPDSVERNNVAWGRVLEPQHLAGFLAWGSEDSIPSHPSKMADTNGALSYPAGPKDFAEMMVPNQNASKPTALVSTT